MNAFIDRLLRRSNAPTSAQVAKDRLRFVLVHDRLDISPDRLEEMKDEIIAVISRYVRIDHSKVEITIEQRQRDNWLVADIPLAPDDGA